MAKPGSATFEEIREGLEKKSLTYIDVRNKEELEKDGKIVGSFNIPLPELGDAFARDDKEFQESYGFAKPSKDSTNVVVGCMAGRRGLAGAELLVNLGYECVRVYPGSFGEWKAKEAPIEK